MVISYKLIRPNPVYQENWDYYEGEQFKYWIGSFPSYTDPNREKILTELQKVFICANLTREGVNRHVDALVSEFPQFQVKLKTDPEKEEPTEGQEAEKIIREWLDTLLNMAVQDTDDDISPITKAVIRMAVSGVGYLRLFSRKRYAFSPNLNQRVSLHCPDNGQIVMVYDEEGSLEAIEYLFDSGKIERQTLDPVTGILNFRIYRNREDQLKDIPSPEEPPYDLDLNFNWSIFRIQAPPIITESVKDLQNAVNLVLTMLGRNVVTAGFLERLLLNAQSPGNFVEDPVSGDRVFIPDSRGFATGAGAVSFIQGIPLGDDPLAPEGYTTPQAVFRDPVDVTSFEKSLNIFVQRFYNEVGQGHILTQGDGSISGVSRIQLTQDFKSTLKKHTEAIESMLNNVFYSALMMLTPLMGEGNTRFKNFFITSKLRLSDHLITPEEVGQVRENFKAGIVSHPTTLAQLGIDDPQRELEIIDEERQAKIDLMVTEMEAVAPIQQTQAKPIPSQKKTTK